MKLILFMSLVVVVRSTHTDWNSYITAWRSTKESAKMYPCGPDFGDSSLPTINKYLGINSLIDFPVAFYGKIYTGIFLSIHGRAIMSQAAPNLVVEGYIYQTQWPNRDYPYANDSAFIAPFLSEVNMRPESAKEKSQLYYRTLNINRILDATQYDITKGMLEELSRDIRASVVGAGTFQAKFAIIATWYQVTFASSQCEMSSNSRDCMRNTYQMAIVANEVDTYTIYNYYDINWVGAAGLQQCDPATGTATTSYPNCSPAHVGFNAGEGRQFIALPQSNKVELVDIDQTGGSNVTGRFFYKVSDSTLIRGGCTNATTIDPTRWPLSAYPVFGTMLGGHEVSVSGPCFTNPANTKCRFGNVLVDAISKNNILYTTCIQPRLNITGVIKLSVSTNGGAGYYYEIDYTVVPLDAVKADVQILLTPENNWLSLTSIQLNWNSALLGIATVDVSLLGYREAGSASSRWGEWKELKVFASAIDNVGTYTIDVLSHQCTADSDCINYDVGLFRVSYSGQHPTNPQSLYSSLSPTAWYAQTALVTSLGEDWYRDKCSTWHMGDKIDVAWRSELTACPCTLGQALIDFGRFQPVSDCDLNRPASKTCQFHNGAEHCVWSSAVSVNGGGSQCCYDERGYLIYSGDNHYGGTPARHHPDGVVPTVTTKFVPTLSHWTWDVTAFYWCCEWQTTDTDCYGKYTALRLTEDCRNYKPAGQALVFGDPHIVTFDGLAYTFNGNGEFWLLHVSNATINNKFVQFTLQGRFEKPRIPGMDVRATYLTAIAMQQNISHLVVSVRLTTASRYRLEVFVNSTQQLVYDAPSFTIDHKEFLLIDEGAKAGSAKMENISVIYRTGVGVRVSHLNGLLQLFVTTPQEFYGNTKGLLGQWNDNIDDELQPRTYGSSPLPANSSVEKIHYDFGMTWQTASSESRFIFLYWARLDHNYYQLNYTPAFSPEVPPGHSISDSDVMSVCQNDYECTFDYKVTLNANVAKDAMIVQAWDNQRRAMGNIVASCGWLNVLNAVKQQPISYLVGSEVTIVGCRDGYTLRGRDEKYTCFSAADGMGEYSPRVNVECVYVAESLNTAAVVGIVFVSVFICALLILLVIFLILWRKKKRNENNAQQMQDATTDLFLEPDLKHQPILRPTAGPPRPPLSQSPASSPTNDNMYDEDNLSINKADLNETYTPSGDTDQMDSSSILLSTSSSDKKVLSKTNKKIPPKEYLASSNRRQDAVDAIQSPSARKTMSSSPPSPPPQSQSTGGKKPARPPLNDGTTVKFMSQPQPYNTESPSSGRDNERNRVAGNGYSAVPRQPPYSYTHQISKTTRKPSAY